MKTYLVGGAVRDKIMGSPVVDRDWVVVGTTPEAMIQAGFRPVGKHFPVFLHPETQEEYALARTERKTGPGYHGFEFNTSVDVTLEEDLERRDLTINAIAEDESGALIDPFNGHDDIKNKLIRHVSPAFAEDPVRILRVARFMARFAPKSFQIADETLALMRKMVDNGEADNLVAERVWQELENALNAPAPAAFFASLERCGALSVVLNELSEVPDAALQTGRELLQKASGLIPEIQFSCYCYGVLATSTNGESGSSAAHLCERLCERLRVPGKFRDLALMSVRYYEIADKADTASAAELVALLNRIDVLRKPGRFEHFINVCQLINDSIGINESIGMNENVAINENDDLSESANSNKQAAALTTLKKAATAFASIDAAGIAKACTVKSEIPAKLAAERENAIAEVLSQRYR